MQCFFFNPLELPLKALQSHLDFVVVYGDKITKKSQNSDFLSEFWGKKNDAHIFSPLVLTHFRTNLKNCVADQNLWT